MSTGTKSTTLVEMGPGVLFKDGVDSFTRGNASESLQYFRQVLRQAKKTGDQASIAWALLHIAMVLRGQHQYNTALHLLEDARTIFSSLGNPLGIASVLQELSFANRELDRNSLALEYGHQALQKFQELGKTLDLAWAYDNMAVIHFNLFHRHESLTYAKKARALFLEFNSQNGLAWNACNLANLYLEMGFFVRAERYHLEAIKAFGQLKNRQGVAWSHLGLATVYRAQCRFDSAQEMIEKAKEAFKSLNLKDRVGWCLLNQAAIKRTMGQEEEAMLINKRAIQLFGPLRNHDGVAWSLFQIGQLFRDRGHYVKAWQTFREALNLHTDIANRKGIGWAENDWGKTYLELNDQSHARECFIKAKVIGEQLDETPLKVDVDKNLARLYLDEGLLQKANTILEQVEITCRKIQSRETEAEVLIERSRYYLIIGDMVKARQCIRQASSIVEAFNLDRLKTVIGLVLGEILVGEGKAENAMKVWHDVVQLAQKLRQRRLRTEALLGICQLLNAEKMPSQLALMLVQIDKDVRALSSRKLKAKFLFVKSLIGYAQTGTLDNKLYTPALQILETSGLTVLARQFLGVLCNLYKKDGKDRESAECETLVRQLLDKGAVDLHMVVSRDINYKSMPVSIVA